VRRLLAAAAQRTETVQFAINGAKLIECESAGLKAIDQVLRAAAALRQKGRVEVETVQRVAAALSRPREAAPLRSILRPAA
jgi:hypothetical protein